MLAIGLAANAANLFTGLTDALLGAAIGYSVFAAISALFLRLRGYEGLGGGDAKLLAAIGAWGGWQALPYTVFVGAAATLGVIFIAQLGGMSVSKKTAFPFGPGLCIGALATFLSIH